MFVSLASSFFMYVLLLLLFFASSNSLYRLANGVSPIILSLYLCVCFICTLFDTLYTRNHSHKQTSSLYVIFQLLFRCCSVAWRRGLSRKFACFVMSYQISVRFNLSCIWILHKKRFFLKYKWKETVALNRGCRALQVVQTDDQFSATGHNWRLRLPCSGPTCSTCSVVMLPVWQGQSSVVMLPV